MSLSELMSTGKTLVLAHRGAMVKAPMNTLSAFALARQDGADGIEFDVRLSRDSIPVIIHDCSVDATTDGAGLVSDLTLAQLKALDAGSWFAAQFASERIPTLDEVFAAFNDTACIFNIEIKSPGAVSRGVESIVADSIRRFQMQERVIISSFDPQVLLRVRESMPKVAIGALMEPDTLNDMFAALNQLRPRALHPRHEMVDEAFIQWAGQNECLVIAWTVNDPRRALQLRDLGVDAIITDHPELIASAFAA